MSAKKAGPRWRTSSRREGTPVGTVRAQVLHEAMVRAAAAALQTGVPVEKLSALRGVDRRQQRRLEMEAVRGEIARAQRRQRNAEASAGEAETTEERRRYTRSAREAGRRVVDLQSQLKHLAEDPAEPPLPAQLRGRFGPHLLALAAFSAVGRMEAEDAEKATDLIQDQVVLPTADGKLSFSYRLRLPMEDGVYALGPIRGTVCNSARGNSRGMIKVSLPPGATQRLARSSPQDLGSVLDTLADAGLNAAAIRTLTSCAIPYVPHAVLEGLMGPMTCPSLLPPHWRDPSWLEHLAVIYSVDDFGWAGGRWFVDAPSRQALVDVVAAGARTLEQVKSALLDAGIGVNKVNKHSAVDGYDGNGSARPWQPGVVRVGDWVSKGRTPADRGLAPVTCPRCRLPATLVMRVPEIPGDLLCRRCGQAPAAPDLPVPAEYLSLTPHA